MSVVERSERLSSCLPCREWSEAFDLCRERDRPVDVVVVESGIAEYATVFPSGHCRTMRRCVSGDCLNGQ